MPTRASSINAPSQKVSGTVFSNHPVKAPRVRSYSGSSELPKASGWSIRNHKVFRVSVWSLVSVRKSIKTFQQLGRVNRFCPKFLGVSHGLYGFDCFYQADS